MLLPFPGKLSVTAEVEAVVNCPKPDSFGNVVSSQSVCAKLGGERTSAVNVFCANVPLDADHLPSDSSKEASL